MENLLGAGGRNIWVTQKLNDKSKVRHHCESLPLVMIMTTVERMLDVEELWRQRTEEEEEEEKEEEERKYCPTMRRAGASIRDYFTIGLHSFFSFFPFVLLHLRTSLRDNYKQERIRKIRRRRRWSKQTRRRKSVFLFFSSAKRCQNNNNNNLTHWANSTIHLLH